MYAEATRTQKLVDFTGLTIRAFEFFSCVPKIVVYDSVARHRIGHQRARHASEVSERVLMARDPRRAILRLARFREGEARRSQHGDEQLDRDEFVGPPIDNRRLLARVVDDQRLARAVDLPHGQLLALEPAPVDLVEGGVAEPSGYCSRYARWSSSSVTPSFLRSRWIQTGSGRSAVPASRGP